jgi:hypothetical protein
MDAASLYGLGHSSNQPPGLLTTAYSGSLQSVSMSTNGGSFTAASGQYNPFMQAVDKCRTANEDGPLRCYTHPAVAASADAGTSTLNTYITPPDYIREIWPPVQSTAFSRTETQGTSSVTSSAVVFNPNRILTPMRMRLTFQQLDERYADFLQTGFLAYVRHDWAFPYAAAATRVQGILPAAGF